MINTRAQEIYAGSLVWDSHAGFELNSERDLETLSVWKEAGVDFLSVNVGYDVWNWKRTIKALALARRWIDESDLFQRVGTAAEVDKARAEGRMAIAFDIEGMSALDGSTDMIYLYHSLGVRQMLFAYNLNNEAGGGCHDTDAGLTSFGRSIIGAMNNAGMLIDCSHTGYRTTMEAMEVSSDPVVFSHSNSRALRDHERNIKDDQALACAASGGVVGVNGIGIFLGVDDIRTTALIQHIQYYVDLIGIEHVGIGLDYFCSMGDAVDLNDTLVINSNFWPTSQYPDGRVSCASPVQLLEVVEHLLKRGFSEKEVRAILGGNFRRIANAVWKNPDQ